MRTTRFECNEPDLNGVESALLGIITMDAYTRPGEEHYGELMRQFAREGLEALNKRAASRDCDARL